jgi:hypothetical protein
MSSWTLFIISAGAHNQAHDQVYDQAQDRAHAVALPVRPVRFQRQAFGTVVFCPGRLGSGCRHGPSRDAFFDGAALGKRAELGNWLGFPRHHSGKNTHIGQGGNRLGGSKPEAAHIG